VANNEVLAAAIAIVIDITTKTVEDKNKETKKKWIRPWIQRRKQIAAFNTLLRQFAVENPRSFFKIFLD